MGRPQATNLAFSVVRIPAILLTASRRTTEMSVCFPSPRHTPDSAFSGGKSVDRLVRPAVGTGGFTFCSITVGPDATRAPASSRGYWRGVIHRATLQLSRRSAWQRNHRRTLACGLVRLEVATNYATITDGCVSQHSAIDTIRFHTRPCLNRPSSDRFAPGPSRRARCPTRGGTT